MNTKPDPEFLADEVKRLNLRVSKVDDEVASTHPIQRKIGARQPRNASDNPTISKSMSEIGMRRSFEEASEKSISFHPSDASSITLKLRPSRTSVKNFTFNANQVRDIERNNQTLMKKIMHTKVTDDIRRTSSSTSGLLGRTNGMTASAAINRKKQQRQIDIGNDILQRKLMQISRRRPTLVPK